ncbi:MAG: HlyD family secretion protein [Flavobacterium psychrophilum]|nr:MAG: HlyD family secretion protein [Flavobacterium psychrophilum]
MPNSDSFELRSEELQEILTRIPHWMIRWGNMVIFAIILLLFAFSWIIKYPEIITADITVTTSTPPERIIARSTGRLYKILVTNQEKVKSSTPLAVIENPADYRDVFRLKEALDSIRIVNGDFFFPFDKLHGLRLGEISNSFALFEKEYIAYRLNFKLKPHAVEGIAQSYETSELNKRLNLLLEQEKIAELEGGLKKKRLQRYKQLHDKGVISAQEWESENLQFLQFEKGLRELKSTISQVNSSLNQLNRDRKTTSIIETKDDTNLFSTALQSYDQLVKAVATWELQYVLRSSIDGEVTFLQIWKENQTVNSGDNIFTVIPSQSVGYIGKIRASEHNSGKIKKGQHLNIRLDNYPDREFGTLGGKVHHIALAPDSEGKILIDVELPDNLITSYHKRLLFEREMSGTADIITEDLRLFERLLYQFKDLIRRQPKDKEI